MLNEYMDLDKQTENGAFTEPTKKDIDMLSLMAYCKKNNILYGSLTELEIDQFVKKVKPESRIV